MEELAVQLPLQLLPSVQLPGLASAVLKCTSLHAGLALAPKKHIGAYMLARLLRLRAL